MLSACRELRSPGCARAAGDLLTGVLWLAGASNTSGVVQIMTQAVIASMLKEIRDMLEVVFFGAAATTNLVCMDL